MSVLSTLVVAPIQERTGSRNAQIGGARSHDASLPGAINWLYPQNTPVIVAGVTSTVPGDVPAGVWPSGASAALDVVHHAYVIFVVQGSNTLWAAKQEDFAAIAAANAVGKIAWVDGTWDLVPRGTFVVSPLFIPSVVGWSGGTYTPPATNYSTTTHGDWGDPTSGGTGRGSAWMGGANFMGYQRVALNLAGNTLVAVDDGTLWYLTTGDAVPGAQVTWNTGVYSYVLGVCYDFAATTWWLLTIESGVYLLYSATSAAPLLPADWTNVPIPTTGGLTDVLGVGPGGRILIRDTGLTHAWGVSVGGGAVTPLGGNDLDTNELASVGYTTQIRFGGTAISVASRRNGVIQDAAVIDAAGGFEDVAFTGTPVQFMAAVDDLAGGLYALGTDLNLWRRPGALGTAWSIVAFGAAESDIIALFQWSPATAGQLQVVNYLDNAGTAGAARARFHFIYPATGLYTRPFIWDFDMNKFRDNSGPLSLAYSAACNN